MINIANRAWQAFLNMPAERGMKVLLIIAGIVGASVAGIAGFHVVYGMLAGWIVLGIVGWYAARRYRHQRELAGSES